MRNLSISSLVVWPQVMNKIVFVWGQWRQGFNLSHAFIFSFIFFHLFFLGIILFFIFASFLKLNHKNHTTMDEDRDKIEYPNQMLKKEDHSDKNLHLTHPFHANSNIFHISSEIF